MDCALAYQPRAVGVAFARVTPRATAFGVAVPVSGSWKCAQPQAARCPAQRVPRRHIGAQRWRMARYQRREELNVPAGADGPDQDPAASLRPTDGKPSRSSDSSQERQSKPRDSSEIADIAPDAGPNELDKLVVDAGALPTLFSLSGRREKSAATSADSTVDDEAVLANMGAGLTAAEEEGIVEFLRSVYEEFKLIEWPSFGRVIKVVILVIVTIAVATSAIYVIDGVFYKMSQVLFETNV